MSNKTIPSNLVCLIKQEIMNIIAELRSHVHGWVEWRVQDPVSKSYCISFSRYGEGWVLDPENEALEWLRKHRAEFPSGQFVNYEVVRLDVQTKSDMLMSQVADKLEQMAALIAASDDVLDTELSDVEKDIMNALNKRFQSGELHPQKAALYLAEMIPSLLDTLAWKPQNVQAAINSARETIRHLGGI